MRVDLLQCAREARRVPRIDSGGEAGRWTVDAAGLMKTHITVHNEGTRLVNDALRHGIAVAPVNGSGADER